MKKEDSLHSNFRNFRTDLTPRYLRGGIEKILSSVANKHKFRDLRNIIANKGNEISINQSNYIEMFSTALETRNDILIRSCFNYLHDRTGVYVEDIDFQYASFDTILKKFSFSSLNDGLFLPIFEIYKNILGIPYDQHKMSFYIGPRVEIREILLLLDKYGSNLKSLILSTGFIIRDELLNMITDKCKNIEELSFKYHPNSDIEQIASLKLLRRLEIKDGFWVTSLDISNFAALEELSILDMKRIKSISLDNLPNLRFVNLCSCDSLKYLNIENSPKIDNVSLINCPVIKDKNVHIGESVGDSTNSKIFIKSFKKISNSIIDFMEKEEVNEHNLDNIITLALESRSVSLQRKYLYYLYHLYCEVYVTVKGFDQPIFEIFQEELALSEIDEKMIKPILSIFKAVYPVSIKKYEISLDISSTSSLNELFDFIEKYGENISLIYFLDKNVGINDELLRYIAYYCKNLKKFELCFCDKITTRGIGYLRSLPKLQKLKIECCDKLFDFEIENFKNLRELIIENLDFTKTIRLKNLPLLENFDVYNCKTLKHVIIENTGLENIRLTNCQQLKHVIGLDDLSGKNLVVKKCNKFSWK